MRRVALLAVALTVACSKKDFPPPPHASVLDPQKRDAIKAPPVVQTIANLSAPESALYDPEQDVYFISSMNGGLLDRDGNGFISRIDVKTMQVNMKWIEGGKNGVALDAPKGMAVAGNTLWVADVAAVRKFDRHTGAPQGSIALPGATTINDVATDGTNVWVSDTGVIPNAGETFTATGTDSVWKITNDQASKIASGQDLEEPNGLAVADGKLWVVTFGGNHLYRLEGNARTSSTNLPREQLDGLVALPGGDFLVSGWKGMAIYRGKPGGEFTPILQSIATPADIGYDTKRHLLLVPSTSANRVTLHALPAHD